jgi:uracil-DNA glycosylase family 4
MDQPQTDKSAALTVLAEAASGCTACGLSATRSNVVFGVGKADTPLMLIGEGPGMNEDATGIPFVGRAGQLLDECLREAGMLRKHVYIANVLKCRAAAQIDGRLQNRPPTAEEVAACVPLWLEKQIAIIQPLVIVCLGAPSANTIIHRNFRMLQERGKWFECKYANYAMAALHPAYILRQEGDEYTSSRQSLVNDLSAARLKAIEAKKEPKMSLF